MYTIPGHHHISMLSKDIRTIDQFYQKVLGLRRVKKTVNQDTPSMYHLFYGDFVGSAGTELTFFEIPNAGRTVRGTNAITQIGLLVPSYDSLLYWKKRLHSFSVEHSGIVKYAGRDALHFEDPEGLRFVLLNHNGEETPEFWTTWEQSDVDVEHRILGMGAIEITVRNLGKLASTLKEVFGYTEVFHSENEAIYQSISGQAFGEIVIKQKEGPNEKPGKGSVHHLAIRAKDDTELAYWDEQVRKRGFHSTGVIDRYYFKSLYFRESNGVLIEIATDGPGFTVDSDVESLGKQLDLPPSLEKHRTDIEALLQPIEEV